MNAFVLTGYGIFLVLILVINVLYFFHIFKYRLPGDASLGILSVYTLLIVAVAMGTDVLLRLWR